MYDVLTSCPVKITKGKKRFSLDGIDLFIRPVKGLLFIYEVNTTKLILVGDENRKYKLLEIIMNRREEIRRMVDDILPTTMEVS